MLLSTKILNIVADFYDIDTASIIGSSRESEVVRVRHIFCYLARKNKQSYPMIGRKLHGRNHATIMSAVKKISLELLKNEELKQDISCLESILERSGVNIKLNVRIEKNKEKNKIKCLHRKKIKLKKYSEKQLKRIKIIVEKYRAGWTLEDIATEFKLTRERVRQIAMAGLAYEVQEKFKKYSIEDVDSFIKKEKEKHLLEKNKRYGKKEDSTIIKEKRWSRDYDHCRRCGTINVKHRSNGYCRWCYPKTEIFKEYQKISFLRNKKKRMIRQREYSREYLKNPEVIAKNKLRNNIKRYDGNREEALRRDGQMCQYCGLTQKESLEMLKRDLFVIRKEGNGNELSNLLTLCQKCHNKKNIKRMHEKLNIIKIRKISPK